MLMQLRGFSLLAEHVPGKCLVVPDTLSRCPMDAMDQTEKPTEEIECYVDSIDSARPIADKP
jgi:hypothetical protein